MKNWLFIVFAVVITIAIVITFGFFIFNSLNNNNNNTNIINNNQNIYNSYYNEKNIDDKIINRNEEIIETSNDIDKVSPACIFIFKTYYPKCEHLKVEKEQVKETMVNKTKEDLEKIYKNWSIVTFRNDEVLFYKEEDGICGEHYLIKEEDGKILIYLLDEDGNNSLLETTGIVTEYLEEEDISRLKEGIRVNGKEELNKALEDYE